MPIQPIRSPRQVPLVLVGGIEGRDFTRGVAEALWAEALAEGAAVVRDADGAERALESQGR